MRFVIQRVKAAEVQVDDKLIGRITQGLLVLVGISESDTQEITDKMLKKLIGLRIFEDENGKTNLDIKAVNGNMLIVSQFTLYADCRKGNRPSFVHAGSPQKANHLYEYILKECAKSFPDVQHGIFGADMKVSLINDGPFTVILDSDNLFPKEDN